jgi:FkbM family methyltransferase
MKTKHLPVEFVRTRKPYILFKNDCGVSDVARWGGIYEPYIFEYIVKHFNIADKTVVDIGANFGFHSIEFSEMVGDKGRVYAFEPQRLVYYQLCGNVILNGLDNVYCYNVGLGDKEKIVELENQNYYSEQKINIGDTHTGKYVENGMELCSIHTLDSYNFCDVSVIKLDVQGYELYVINGMVDTLLRNRPYIFLEIDLSQLQIYGLNQDSVISRLTGLGYVVERLSADQHIVDYVAIPI